jgi:predicted PurR-regulated permease PerM
MSNNENTKKRSIFVDRELMARIFVWGSLFFVLYLLRSFFLLIFLTFVFTYIQGNAVIKLEPYIKKRWLRVVTVAVLFLGVLVAIGNFIIPKVKEQADILANKYPVYMNALDRELLDYGSRYPIVERILPEVKRYDHMPEVLKQKVEYIHNWNPENSPSFSLIRQIFGYSDGETTKDEIRRITGMLKQIGANLLAAGSAFLLSLLFSFLILLDLPKLTESVKSLADTKISFVYQELAGSILDFTSVLGRALEAQLFIAITNTVLTAIGMSLLGLNDHLAFLSLIVFLCSFIPVAGVFISSAPICLLVLQASGIKMVILAIVLILLIHFVETYFLNPRIFGHHLRINPVLVLIILTISGKLFHIWGLILGVPICTYIFGHAIRDKKKIAGSS